MPAHSIPLATVSALFEEERARMRQAWRDYTESLFEDARNRLYVESVYGQLHGKRSRFGHLQSDGCAWTRTPPTPRCVFRATLCIVSTAADL